MRRIKREIRRVWHRVGLLPLLILLFILEIGFLNDRKATQLKEEFNRPDLIITNVDLVEEAGESSFFITLENQGSVESTQFPWIQVYSGEEDVYLEPADIYQEFRDEEAYLGYLSVIPCGTKVKMQYTMENSEYVKGILESGKQLKFIINKVHTMKPIEYVMEK